MKRIIGSGILILACCCPGVGAAGKPAEAPKTMPPLSREEIASRKLYDKLAKHIDVTEGLEGFKPLQDALESLAKKHGLPLVIDEKAFQRAGLPKAGNTPVSLPKMLDISLDVVLRLLAGQIHSDINHGTLVVLPDRIVITTSSYACPATWTDQDRRKGRVPLVSVELAKQPLDASLRRLAARTGINIVLDGSAAGSSKPVTATFKSEPVDLAVKNLAAHAGLEMVVIDNVLYVTTKDKARALPRPAQ